MALTSRTARTHALLLEGCGTAIAEQGLRGLTVEQVIQAAGKSRRTFYHYFPDLDAVLLGLYKDVVADLVGRIEAAVAGAKGPVNRLYAALDAYLDFQEAGGRLVAELQAEAANPASPLWPTRIDTLHVLVDLTHREVHTTSGITVDPDVYSMLFHGLEALVIQHRRQGPFAPEVRARIETTVKAVFLTTLASADKLPTAPVT